MTLRLNQGPNNVPASESLIVGIRHESQTVRRKLQRSNPLPFVPVEKREEGPVKCVPDADGARTAASRQKLAVWRKLRYAGNG